MQTALMAPLSTILRAGARRTRNFFTRNRGASPESPTTWKNHDTPLGDALTAFVEVMERGGAGCNTALIPAVKAFRQLAEDADRPLTVLVMGHFKTGKSTFLNALLGEALLSTDVLPATAAVTVLTWGPERRLRACFADAPPQNLSFETLRGISSESGTEWANTRRHMTHLEVALPHPLLRSLTLVDTPGLNSAHREHSQVTTAFVERADAVIWLFGFPQTGTRTELEAMQKLPPGCRTYAIVNQIDRLDPDEESEEEFLEGVSRSLGALVHPPIGISAKLALSSRNGGGQDALQASRWPQFLELLERDILAERSRQKNSRLLDRTLVALDFIATPVEAARRQMQSAAESLREEGAYTRNLRERIDALAALDHAWRPHGDQDSGDLISSAPDLGLDVDESVMLTRDREVLRGVLDGVAAEAKELNEEGRTLHARLQDHDQRIDAHNQRVEEYRHSGLFGGPPILGGLFDGGERERIDQAKLEFDREAAEINLGVSQLKARGESYDSRLEPVRRDCDEFVARVHQAILRGVQNLEYDLDHREEARTRATEIIREHGWARKALGEMAKLAIPALERTIAGTDPLIANTKQIEERLLYLKTCARDIDAAMRVAESQQAAPLSRADRTSLRLETEQQKARAVPQATFRGSQPARRRVLPALIFVGVVAAIVGMFVKSRSTSGVAGAGTAVATSTAVTTKILDRRSILALSFPTLPQDSAILQSFYGNTRGIRGAAIWTANQLPQGLDRSRLNLDGAEAEVHFRIAHREEYRDSGGVNRLFVAVAGTGAAGPDTLIDCHACGVILGIITLRENRDAWRVEAVNRAVAVLGDFGEPARSYSVVKWGTDRLALKLQRQIMNQGYGSDQTVLVGAVDGRPRVIAELATGATNCGAVGEAACRSESGEMSFIEDPGKSAWDLQVGEHVTAGLRVGEPASTLRRFRFEGQSYKEVAATQEAASPESAAILTTLEKWRWATVSRNLDAILELYAPVLERYYLQTNYTHQQVRDNKRSFFEKYPIDIRCEFSNIRLEFITPTRVLLAFRKDWEASGHARSSGAVRTELIMASIDGKWKIISELDRNLEPASSPAGQ